MVLLIYDSVSVFVPNSACSCRPTITGESNFAINKTILILMCPTKSYPLLPRSVGCKRRSRRPKWALLANIPCESEPMIRQSPAFEKAAASRSKPKNSKNQKILHKTITISTYNVRTLKQTGKLHQLIYGCNQNNIDLVAVQEHRWQTSEQTNRTYQTLNDKYWRFEYCSATPEGHGGIGLLMNPRMGNPAMTVIVTYAPTEDKNEREKIPSTTTYKGNSEQWISAKSGYRNISRYTHGVPTHNVLILAGDLNARLGSDSHTTNPRAIGKYTYHQSTYDNGNRLVNYCKACNMRSTQTRFPQPQSRSWTWLHPNGKSKAQLDHILINGKWLNSIRNVRASGGARNSH
ncbi:unnamed protein product [Adineta ricciae]|uniref:Endonuclease/exonuclease/phosphatase domain-containing protein n=1 Tax=Adineta ricciae TaxID=249248 RepID=A0A816DWW0_ADIRI|nr:unnamed protein product [Adineta ricciae]